MRLLVAHLDQNVARQVCLQMEADGWEAHTVRSGHAVLEEAQQTPVDLLLLHACLGGLDGLSTLMQLRLAPPLCAPRILLVCDPALHPRLPAATDCTAPLCATPQRLCTLLHILAKKPLPKLAAVHEALVARETDAFLHAVGMRDRFKGRSYAAWMLRRLVASPLLAQLPMGAHYQACAEAFGTTSAAVERCVRVAVESVFTQGDLRGIEHYFGATVDPERGKPTNRAFLLQASQRLREQINP